MTTKNTFKIGQKFNKTYPVEAAVWCNANGAHIELVEGKYTIVANAPAPEPTKEEQVQALERETGLTREVRELVLAKNSGVSAYVKNSDDVTIELYNEKNVSKIYKLKNATNSFPVMFEGSAIGYKIRCKNGANITNLEIGISG